MIAIMQPYFLPYIGYWQLLNSVDCFVLYDDIQYEKKGWINRNRYLSNGYDKLFTIALEKASDYLNVVDRNISPQFNRTKFLNQIKEAYKRAPYFNQGYQVLVDILKYQDENLFRFIENSIFYIKDILDIRTDIIVSSTIKIDKKLKSAERVIATCKACNDNDYVNPIGGMKLYDKNDFLNHGVKLSFLKTGDISYKQFNNDFIPSLSILDILMFNDIETIKSYLGDFTLI